jgi:WD40 repeat protein
VLSLAVSADGRHVVSGSSDQTVRLWDTFNNAELFCLRVQSTPSRSVAFSRDGRRIAAGFTDGQVRVWDALTGNDELCLVGEVETIDALQHGEVHSRYGYEPPMRGRSVNSVGFSPTGRHLVTGGDDGTVRVWDTQSGIEHLRLHGHQHPVSSVAFSPNGVHVVSGSSDGTVRVWDLRSGGEQLRIQGASARAVYCVAFSPCGRLIAAGLNDGTVQVSDSLTGDAQLLIKTLEYFNSMSVAFSADGKWIASGSSRTGVAIWNADNGQKPTASSSPAFRSITLC